VKRCSAPRARLSGGVIEVKLGAKRDGTIVAADLVLKYQAGAFPGSPVQPGCMCAFAMYDLPNVHITGYDVVSNRPKVAAYRAPGAPISSFGVESCLDELARELGMDSAGAEGEKMQRRKAPRAVHGPTLDQYRVFSTHWRQPRLIRITGSPSAPIKAAASACGFWFNVGGESSAQVHVNEDGSVSVASGSPDIGGSRASMAMMAAETLGIPVEARENRLSPTPPRSASHMWTGGSRVTFATGMATVQATEKVIDQLKQRAAMIWDISPEAIDWRDGCAYPAGPNARQLRSAAIGRKSRSRRPAPAGRSGAEVSVNAQGAGPALRRMFAMSKSIRKPGM